MSRILIVDDQAGILQTLNHALKEEGHEVEQALGGEKAQKLLQNSSFDLMISDIKMEPMDGHELLRIAKTIQPSMAVVMLTGDKTTESAVMAMKQGAFDYVTKPFKPDELKITVQRALEYKHLIHENDKLRAELEAAHGFDGMIAESAPMRRVCEMISRVAPTDSTVLITGQSGTGKEVVAKTIHNNSVRKKQPFVPINCSGIPENLLESELFGHKKGAFTGADSDREGLFMKAEGGTLFLDEIGTMPMSLQAKLLRALQEREIRPVGSDVDVSVNVRVVAATNEKMEHAIRDNYFREDLYFRLAVIELELPPLKERVEDIIPLAAHFLRRMSNGTQASIQPDTREHLESYAWPGNVRELENTIQYACTFSSDGTIHPEHLPPKILSRSTAEVRSVNALSSLAPGSGPVDIANVSFQGKSLKLFLRQKEVEYLVSALEHFDGDKELTAKELGISLATLYRKLPEPTQ